MPGAERFDYDPTNQLKKVSYDADQVWTGSPLNATRTVDYTYTPGRSNRQSVTDNGSGSNYVPNGMNQYTNITDQSLAYYEKFNLRFLNGGTVNYDADKRVTSVTAGGTILVQNTYDGLGRVVRRTDPERTLLFAYDGWKEVTDYDAWNNLRARNVYGPGPDKILLRVDFAYGIFFYHSDKQGSVTHLLGRIGPFQSRLERRGDRALRRSMPRLPAMPLRLRHLGGSRTTIVRLPFSCVFRQAPTLQSPAVLTAPQGSAGRSLQPWRLGFVLDLLFSRFLFARTVFDGTALGIGQRIVVLLFVHAKLGLHSRFFVKHFPDRGRLIPAMFLIGECLEGPVEDKRKGDRDSRGLLVSHAADGVIANMTGQENSILTSV